ncbi:hypothetical protein [Ruegeria atlantica]|uniref:hypothetical protein n=1 Tax=Ruegeria atlantica TaxID=81569 RepID=UPI00147B8419|nr:hypothetical protein [Ruegeria atlantica]
MAENDLFGSRLLDHGFPKEAVIVSKKNELIPVSQSFHVFEIEPGTFSMKVSEEELRFSVVDRHNGGFFVQVSSPDDPSGLFYLWVSEFQEDALTVGYPDPSTARGFLSTLQSDGYTVLENTVLAQTSDELKEIYDFFVTNDAIGRVVWTVYDLDSPHDKNEFRKLAEQGVVAFSVAKEIFPDFKQPKQNSDVSGNENENINNSLATSSEPANHCMKVTYEAKFFRVRVRNSCEFSVRINHCERTKTAAAESLWSNMLGWSRPIHETCRSYVLAPENSNTFTFVRNLDDPTVPGIYKLNSPLSYRLNAFKK